jgi:hypothetical protein
MSWSVSTKRYELFPSIASYIRLIGTCLMGYIKDWEMEIYEARLNAACEHFLTLSENRMAECQDSFARSYDSISRPESEMREYADIRR